MQRGRIPGVTMSPPAPRGARRPRHTHQGGRGESGRSYGFGRAFRLTLALAALLIGAAGMLGGLVADRASAQDTASGSTVYVIPIQGEIEPGIGHYLSRSIDDAVEAGATAVIFDINTPGGRLDTVLEMRDAILGAPIETIAYVNREAFSAGALITIASDQIWMAPGAVFGAATPVNGGTGETSSEKVISAVRSTFGATAAENNRDVAVAEAMVDPAVVVEQLNDTGQGLVTLSAEQAQQVGYLTGSANSVNEVISLAGYAGAAVTETSMSPAEHLVRFVTNPGFASLLVLVGLFLIVADAFVGGFGVAAAIGALLIGLFFWGHLLAGLAGWEDLALIVIGLVLLAVEVFVFPGFGIAGLAGLVSVGGGVWLAMIGRDFGAFQSADDMIRTAWIVILTVAGAAAGAIGAGALLPRMVGAGSSTITTTSRRRFGGGGLALSATVDEDRRARAGTERPSWMVRMFQGDSVLERDDHPLKMPAGRDDRPVDRRPPEQS
ncbi:MAG TPA: hypothetical protein VGT61_00305 [Thermomicrobiales bacterium]|jgi:membrane-bound serine protease (ClpP class)|nr:hypothetical protein [Thermomicrobiales bacterium]